MGNARREGEPDSDRPLGLIGQQRTIDLTPNEMECHLRVWGKITITA